jgi:hypothetical protein
MLKLNLVRASMSVLSFGSVIFAGTGTKLLQDKVAGFATTVIAILNTSRELYHSSVAKVWYARR